MARQITTMPRVAPTMIEVPEDVATDLSEAVQYLADNPSEVCLVNFDDQSGDEKELFIRQARSWATASGLKFSVTTSSRLGPTGLRFWVGTHDAWAELRAAAAPVDPDGEPRRRGRPRKIVPAAEFASA